MNCSKSCSVKFMTLDKYPLSSVFTPGPELAKIRLLSLCNQDLAIHLFAFKDEIGFS